ncbi:MAG: hypothetical protein AAFV45_14795 [Pseudomonadota bacterium]
MTFELSATPAPAFLSSSTEVVASSDLPVARQPVMIETHNDKAACTCTRIGVCGAQQAVAMGDGSQITRPDGRAVKPLPVYDANRLCSHIGLLDPPPPRS